MELEYIDTSEQQEQFRNHLELSSRTILSAKFGDGKSRFLRDFYNRYKDELMFLTIHPVNYSVATNEDIFEYIKFDILLQLATKGLTPDVDTSTLWSIVKENVVSLDNLNSASDFVLDLFPGTSTVKKIKDGVVELIKSKDLTQSLEKYKSNSSTVAKYNKIFKSQIGGLYEQDGYTILIQEILKSIQTRKVLVVEDLDRLDPGHLFRILNVFAAHIDQSDNNKFGFDNIIFVLDYEVTRHIFHHFYGKEADYEGYMSKFLVNGIFRFSINSVAQEVLTSFLREECKYQPNPDIKVGIEETFDHQLTQLSVRDIGHALKTIENQYIETTIKADWGDEFSTVQPIVKFIAFLNRLNNHFNTETIIAQLKRQPFVIDMLCGYLFFIPGIHSSNPFTFKSKNYVVTNGYGKLKVISATLHQFNQPKDITTELDKAINKAKEFVL